MKFVINSQLDSTVEIARGYLAPSGYIWGISVDENYRQQGNGNKLLAGIIAAAKQSHHAWVRLRVHVDNKTALDWYIRKGFVETGVYGRDEKVWKNHALSTGEWTELELEIDEEAIG